MLPAPVKIPATFKLDLLDLPSGVGDGEGELSSTFRPKTCGEFWGEGLGDGDFSFGVGVGDFAGVGLGDGAFVGVGEGEGDDCCDGDGSGDGAGVSAFCSPGVGEAAIKVPSSLRCKELLSP